MGPVAWRLCPPDYYDLGLEERQAILGAHSTSQLCKAWLFENRNFAANTTTTTMTNDDDDGGEEGANANPTNSGYYLIVIQYVESINVKKLGLELRGLRPPGQSRFDPGYFANLRLAPEEASVELTGYGRNNRYLSSSARASSRVCGPNSSGWMGGGHRDWELDMAVSEFLQGVNAIVLDVSEPRA